jgi:CYTH domain-containing protein/CHAD domain-containing protein
MAFRLEHSESVGVGVRRVATERLDDAIALLEGLPTAGPTQVESSVHQIRKHCKELRGLMRLVRPALGDEYARSNRAVRDAAEQLSSIRDAQALLATFADLREAEGGDDRHRAELDSIERAQADKAAAAGRAIGVDDPRVQRAHRRLTKVRRRTARWEMPDGFDALAGGLEVTYRRGRRGLRRAVRDTTDDRMHEWRKRVKYLWYQMRLLEPTAPSVLSPLVDRLDDLADALGDDHDLAVLIHSLDTEGERFGGRDRVGPAVDLARRRQADLRRRAFSLGARLYAEAPDAFVARIGAYWKIDRRHGEELRTGSIADLSGLDEDRGDDWASTVERERKFLVAERPSLTTEGERIRQGYLAVDGKVSARVRDRAGSGFTLTIKGGSGSTRTELEWELDRTRFEALWPLAERRGIDKTRYRVPVGEHTADLDVFEGTLEGLWMVEVEFESEEAMAEFEPPSWFGDEVTDDVRYTNAHMAVHGLAPRPSRSAGDPPGAGAE